MFTGEGTRGLVEACNIRDVGDTAVHISSGASTAIVGNEIHRCKNYGVVFQSFKTTGRLEGNTIWECYASAVVLEERANPLIVRNVIRDNPGLRWRDFWPTTANGITVDEGRPFRNLRISADNVFERNAGGDFGGEGGKAAQMGYEDERSLPAIATWWEAQHRALLAARAAGAAPRGWVFPPKAFDVTVRPGECVQEAVERCPRGGSILMLPGVHEGQLYLEPEDEVHMFGMGRAVLRENHGSVIGSESLNSTIDGLVLRFEWEDRESAADKEGPAICVEIVRTGLRLQSCDICTVGPASSVGVQVSSGADAVVSRCRCAPALLPRVMSDLK